MMRLKRLWWVVVMNKLTDKELFIQFYKQVGIELKQTVNDKGNGCFILSTTGLFDKERTTSDKFDGYCDFYSDVEFTPEGKFIKQGFWE